MGVRIVSWNCAMGYAKKRWLLEALQPDVAVLPEVSQRHIAETDARSSLGRFNSHKGLGVIGFTYCSYILHEAECLLPWHIPFIEDGLNIAAYSDHMPLIWTVNIFKVVPFLQPPRVTQ